MATNSSALSEAPPTSPPSTSGTRDALAELILTKGCDTDPAMKALKDSDKKKVLMLVKTEDGQRFIALPTAKG